MSAPTSTQHSLVVGIDFGTTFSGVAWAHTSNPDAIKILDQWPGGGNKINKKVQSQLAYYERNGIRGYKWGSQLTVTDVSNRLTWFKLLLDERGNSSSRNIGISRGALPLNARSGMTDNLEQLRSTISAMPIDKKPVDLVTDYLKGLHQHLKAKLRATYPDAFLDVTPIHYFLTVPANWSDTAKNETLQAARGAGFGDGITLKVVGEPEAAANCVFREYKETENCLKVDDVYVVADCGGGTVDLISYKITSVEPLKVVECAMGTAGFCGSTFLDSAFIELLKERMGASNYHTMGDQARHTAQNHFTEYLKTNFTVPEPGDPGYDEDDIEDMFPCPVPGVKDSDNAGTNGGYIVLSQEDMKGIFQQTFADIMTLVQKQVTAAETKSGKDITAILLVGGFGSSEYLKKHLETNIRSSKGESIKVLQPPEALTAVVRGAVIYGMAHKDAPGNGIASGMVASRVARFSYGMKIMEPFMRGLHPLHRLGRHHITGELFCLGRTSWFVEKGDDLPEDIPIKRLYSRSKEAKDHMSTYIFEEEIICSDADFPPYYDDDPSIFTLLTYTTDFTREHRKSFQKKKGLNNKTYNDITFDIVMRRESALFEFWTERNGVKKGEGVVEYSHERPTQQLAIVDPAARGEYVDW